MPLRGRGREGRIEGRGGRLIVSFRGKKRGKSRNSDCSREKERAGGKGGVILFGLEGEGEGLILSWTLDNKKKKKKNGKGKEGKRGGGKALISIADKVGEREGNTRKKKKSLNGSPGGEKRKTSLILGRKKKK